jgi:hypothetical protein
MRCRLHKIVEDERLSLELRELHKCMVRLVCASLCCSEYCDEGTVVRNAKEKEMHA